MESVTGTVEEAMVPGAPMLLAGPASKALVAGLRAECKDDAARRAMVATFFLAPADVKEIWNLAQTILTGGTASVRNRVVHSSDVLRSVQVTHHTL